MRPLAAEVRRVAVKRRRAQMRGGPSEEQGTPVSKRPTVRASPPLERLEPPSVPVDLTVDTSPEDTMVGEVAADEPAPMGSASMEPSAGSEPQPGESGHGQGAGPAGGSPHPEQAPVDSPPRAETEYAGDAQGSGARSVPRGSSLLNNIRRAEDLATLTIQPDFLEELRTLGVNRFFREAYSAIIRLTNSLALTREAIGEGEALANQIKQDCEDAEARAETAEKALEEAERRAANEAHLRREALRQLSEAGSAIEARDQLIANLRLAIEKVEDQAKRADDRASQAEAEVIAKEAERAAAVSSLAMEREARAAVEASAGLRAAAAVEEFKASEEFTREIVEANADFYLQGFDDAKEKVARTLNFPRALNIEPDMGAQDVPDEEPAAAP